VRTIAGHSPKQSSTPLCYYTTLALKLFRGEPAISEFDWHFTSYHRSSGRFAIRYGSALHVVLPTLQPAHGKVTRFRVYLQILIALFRLAFTMHPSNDLCLHLQVTRWIVLQKARSHPRRGSYSLYAHNFRIYFTPLSGFF
jgi:hypothetical protein